MEGRGGEGGGGGEGWVGWHGLGGLGWWVRYGQLLGGISMLEDGCGVVVNVMELWRGVERCVAEFRGMWMYGEVGGVWQGRSC